MTTRSPSSVDTLRLFTLPTLALCAALCLAVAACAGPFMNHPVARASANAGGNSGADAGACVNQCTTCTSGGSCVAGTSKGRDEAVEVTAGEDHTCALRKSGQVVCWGRNNSGQLGDGTNNRDTPTNVSPL